MSLFFDVGWFDARLGERGLNRMRLAEAAGITPSELHEVFCNRRAATPQELQAFSDLLGAELVDVSLKAGVALRLTPEDAGADARIASIEARLDAIDSWIAELEQQQQRKRA